MFTNLNDYVQNDDDEDDFGCHYRDNMIAQFKQENHQDQDKRDDGLQKRIKFRLNYVVVNEGAPKPDNVFDYDYNDSKKDFFFRGFKYDPEHRELEKFLRITDSENK